jgi:hypothetical protein
VWYASIALAECQRRRPVMSVDVSEDSVELIEAVVTDHQLAFAAD